MSWLFFLSIYSQLFHDSSVPASNQRVSPSVLPSVGVILVNVERFWGSSCSCRNSWSAHAGQLSLWEFCFRGKGSWIIVAISFLSETHHLLLFPCCQKVYFSSHPENHPSPLISSSVCSVSEPSWLGADGSETNLHFHLLFYLSHYFLEMTLVRFILHIIKFTLHKCTSIFFGGAVNLASSAAIIINQFQDIFVTPVRSLMPTVNPCFYPHPQATVNLLSVPTDLSILKISHKWNPTMYGFSCLVSFT